MTFLHFRIHDEPGVILDTHATSTPAAPTSAVGAAGHLWDLHNVADFAGLAYDPARAELVLEWVVPPAVTNPWGDESNHHPGCQLHFRDVTYLAVGPRDPEMPASEDLTLEWCGMAERGASSASTWEFPHASSSAVFRLAFHGGMTIEVVASEVELVASPMAKG